MKEVKIRYIDIEEVRLHEDEVGRYIDEERKEKAERYLNENDRLLSLGASYLLKRFTSSSPLLYTDKGKPYKDGEHFSISHSGRYAVFASSSSPLGIDIEKRRAVSSSLKEAILSEKEKKETENDGDFLRFWCLKESLIKATGEGLSKRLKEVNPIEGVYIYKNKSYASKLMHLDECTIAVSVESEEPLNLSLCPIKFE